jgi:hypothetical protein
MGLLGPRMVGTCVNLITKVIYSKFFQTHVEGEEFLITPIHVIVLFLKYGGSLLVKGRGEGVDDSLLSYTLKYINLRHHSKTFQNIIVHFPLVQFYLHPNTKGEIRRK